jgi:phosphoribosyl 1,2-cyclic phosphate phosphodiesterase
LKITFLGTGTSQGVPVIACECPVCLSADSKDNRLRSSIMIEENGQTFVIDTGPDFRQQMLREKVKKVDAILFTHEHKDHIAGLDDIRSYNWIYKKPMDIYAEERVLKALQVEYSYVFADDKYPGIPEMTLHEIENKLFEIEGISIMPVRALHCKLPVFGYKINNFAYLTDVNSVPEEELYKLKNLDVLVVTALRMKKHISHFNLEEALEFVNLLKPKKTYLTHISHYLGFHELINKELPANVELAYDGLKIEIL